MDVLWIDEWLQAQFPEPPLTELVTDTPRGRVRGIESMATSRANAHLHQLRLKEVLAYVCDQWELPAGKRAEIDAVLDLAEEKREAEEEHHRARVRLEHFEHKSAFFGEQAGLHTESVLSLSLPGKPQEVAQLSLYVVGAESAGSLDPWNARPSGWDQVVGLSLGTCSLEWISLLGLEARQQRRKEKGKADDGLNLELACSVGRQRCLIEDDTLLKLWSALGFAETVACESRSGDADRWSTKRVLEQRKKKKDSKKEENETKWSACEVLVVLYACLGLAWKPDVERTFEEAASDNSDDEMNDDEDIEFEEARKAAVLSVVVRNWRLELRWEFVTRAIRRFFGQRRLALLPAALKTAINLEADHGVELRPADGSHLFDWISYISGSEFGFRLLYACDKHLDSFSVWFLVCMGSGGDCFIFHCDQRTEFGRGLKRLAFDVVGSKLQEKIADRLRDRECPADHLDHHHELFRVVEVGEVEVSDIWWSLLQVVGELLELPPSDTTKEECCEHPPLPECAGFAESLVDPEEVQSLLMLIGAVLQSDSLPVFAKEEEQGGEKEGMGKKKQQQRNEPAEQQLAQLLINHRDTVW